MQQLLTGKLRLRNDEGERFNEEWKKARLGEFFKETTEFVGDRVIEPIAVGVHGIRLRTDIFSKKLSKDYSKNKIIRKNQICFGIGTNSIVFGILETDNIYCVSPAYKPTTC